MNEHFLKPKQTDGTALSESQCNEVLFFPPHIFFNSILASRTNGTFGFARYTGQPFAKPKEQFFANAPMTVYSNIKLTLQTNFKNIK